MNVYMVIPAAAAPGAEARKAHPFISLVWVTKSATWAGWYVLFYCQDILN